MDSHEDSHPETLLHMLGMLRDGWRLQAWVLKKYVSKTSFWSRVCAAVVFVSRENEKFLNTPNPTLFQQLRSLADCETVVGVPDGI